MACGYRHLWRTTRSARAGKNPFVLDSKEPDWSKFTGSAACRKGTLYDIYEERPSGGFP